MTELYTTLMLVLIRKHVNNGAKNVLTKEFVPALEKVSELAFKDLFGKDPFGKDFDPFNEDFQLEFSSSASVVGEYSWVFLLPLRISQMQRPPILFPPLEHAGVLSSLHVSHHMQMSKFCIQTLIMYQHILNHL